MQYLCNRQKLLPELKGNLCHGSHKVVSEGMAKKIAGSGLSFSPLYLAWRRDRTTGIQKLLGQLVDAKFRVTKSDKIISDINAFSKTFHVGRNK